jgi:hypothetical protein
MKNENNFELSNIELNDAEQLVEIKDEELKQVTGGTYTQDAQNSLGTCMHKH